MPPGLHVLDPGPLASLQDDGRPGLARVGLSRGGAADRGAWQLANRLVGNAPGCAALEVTLGGFTAIAEANLLIAITGAEGPVALAGRAVDRNATLYWPKDVRLDIGMPSAGLRSYLAVRGGWIREPVLGSRSWHALAGVGPLPLAAGDALDVGEDTAYEPVVDHVAVAPLVAEPVPGGEPLLEGTWGPRADWLTAAARQRLVTERWAVTDRLDRTGVRLAGAHLRWHTAGAELPSEGVVRGAIQVPPSGQPILFLADHPATGGYPVVAVLSAAAADRAAQLRPGDAVRIGVRDFSRLSDAAARMG